MNKQKITKQIKEYEQKIKELKTQLEKPLYEDSKLKIIKWDKPIKDLPNGGKELAEFQDFADLINSKKFKASEGIYFTKHWSKEQQKKEYCLLKAYLNRNGDWGAYDDSFSDDNSRVVIRKWQRLNLKKMDLGVIIDFRKEKTEVNIGK